MNFKLKINGKESEIEAPSNVRLSALLKDYSGRKSIKQNCRCGKCGHCIVLVDDKPVYSCIYPGYKSINKSVTTLEGITQKSEYTGIIEALDLANVNLCPLCSSSRIILIFHILKENRSIGDYEIQNILESVNCSCTPLENLKEGIYLATNFMDVSK